MKSIFSSKNDTNYVQELMGIKGLLKRKYDYVLHINQGNDSEYICFERDEIESVDKYISRKQIDYFHSVLYCRTVRLEKQAPDFGCHAVSLQKDNYTLMAS